jgi:hypothetical protein
MKGIFGGIFPAWLSDLSTAATIWQIGVPVIIAIAVTVYSWMKGYDGPKLVLAFLVALAAVTFFIATVRNTNGNRISVSGTSTTNAVSQHPNRPFASDQELAADIIKDRQLFLYEVVRDESDKSLIKKKTFVNCTIIGPAIFAGRSSVFSHNSFCTDDDPNAIFLTMPAKKQFGLIGVVDCVFRDCEFMNIAIAGTEEELAPYKKDMAPPPQKPLL